MAIVVVVMLVVLHLQHFQSQLHGTHSPPLQCTSVEQNFLSSHCVSIVVVVIGSVVVIILAVLHLHSYVSSSHSPPLQSASLEQGLYFWHPFV